MISLSTETSLPLLFANNNKALAEAIKQATPAQLALLKESKDVRGLLTLLTTQTLESGKPDKVLLEILKNNPSFKSMGNFPKDLKKLTQTIKSEKTLTSFAPKLEAMTQSIPTLDAPALKRQISQSGIFLESKIMRKSNPKAELKKSLEILSNILIRSKEPLAKPVLGFVKTLLGDKKLTDTQAQNLSTRTEISQTVSKIIKPLQSLLAKRDVIHSKEVTALVQKLESFSKSELFKPIVETIKDLDDPKVKPDKVTTLKPETLEKLQPSIKTEVLKSSLLKSSVINTSELKIAQPLLGTEKTVQPLTPKEVLKKEQLLNLEWVKSERASPKYKASPALVEKLHQNPETFVLKTLTQTLGKLFNTLIESKVPDAKVLIQRIETLVAKIQTQSATPWLLLSDESLGKEIEAILKTVGLAKAKGDVLHSDKIAPLLKTVGLFSKPEQLLPGGGTQNLNQDVKALLLQLQQEVQNTSTPNSTEVLKQIDKLMIQIDYHQLVSYLSNSNALYFPFTWDALKEGKLSFRKGKEKSFYCHIDLELKEFGRLSLMLGLHQEKEVDIQAYTESEELKDLLESNLKTLRLAMSEAGVLARSIGVSQTLKPSDAEYAYSGEDGTSEMGFEVKG